MALERQKRQGVLLLIVLSLLVLFALIGITFIVVANQYDAAAKLQVKVERTGDAPDKIVRTVMLDMLRGSTDLQSPFYRDSLLGDLYGNDGFRGRVVNVPAVPTVPLGGAQLMAIRFAADNPMESRLKNPNSYAGSVLTMTTGRAAGQSTRIVRFISPSSLNGNIGTILVQAFPPSDGVPMGFVPVDGERFVVNGKPFNGTGAGFNAAFDPLDQANGIPPVQVATLNQAVPGRDANGSPMVSPYGLPTGAAPAAFLPFNTSLDELAFLNANPFWLSDFGGSDESYDAADYQNIFLASIPPFPRSPGILTSTLPPGHTAAPIIPSYHRPYLINFWMSRLFNVSIASSGDIPTAMQVPSALLGMRDMVTGAPISPAHPNFRNDLIARPLPFDHPYFTGSNPAFDAFTDIDADGIPDYMDMDIGNDGSPDYDVNGVLTMPLVSGPWDVDNDNDGVADSIWIDPGLPVQTTADGKLYKPLVAILCIDLDGKLNVNAHGIVEHAVSGMGYSQSVIAAATAAFGTTSVLPPPNAPFAGDVAFTNNPLVRGSGYGPAEINIGGLPVNIGVNGSVFQTTPQYRVEYEPLVVTRYGFDRFPGTATDVSTTIASRSPDMAFLLDQMGKPADFFNINQPPTLYGSPDDVRGRRTVVVDNLGRPVFESLEQSRHSQLYGFVFGSPFKSDDLPPFIGGIIPGNYDGRTNTPYELNLLKPNASDDIYTVAELEKLYRFFDSDTQMAELVNNPMYAMGNFNQMYYGTVDPTGPMMDPDRRLAMTVRPFLNSVDAQLTRRNTHLFTTHSFDIPQPNFVVPNREVRQAFINFRTQKLVANGVLPQNITPAMLGLGDFTSFVAFQLEVAIRQTNNTIAEDVLQAEVRKQMAVMLPPEIRSGGKLNINRLLGNGQDDLRDNNLDGNFNAADADLMADDSREAFQVQTMYSNTDGSGVVTSLDPARLPEYIWPELYGQQFVGMFAKDPITNYVPNKGLKHHTAAKQLFARQLFCLSMFLMDQGYEFPFLEGGLNNQEQRELAVRRLAQWAINVVDFRDPDSAFTPFEYDENPFDGWNENIDGDPRTNEVSMGTAPQRRIVWGCEYPELLLTETAAWHDRRVKDTSDETPPDMDENDSGTAAKRAMPDEAVPDNWVEGDASLDQYRIPQGSAFVELYCTRSYLEDSATNPSALLNAFPKDLYRLAPGNNTAVLDLERMSALPGSGNVPYPVWRLAISEAHEMSQSPLGISNIQLNDQAMLDSLSFRPEKMSMLHNQTADIDIERIVWFTRVAPAAGTYEANKIFWNRSVSAFLRPGNYAVVGPRPTTEVSWGVGNTNGSIQQINLTGTTVSHRLNTQAAGDAPAINFPALSIVAQTNPPSTWANAANPDRQIGFNISEPFPVNTGYYPEPNPTNLPRPNVPIDAYTTPHDIPFDEAMDADGNPVSDLFIDLARVRQGALPLETGLVENFKTVFLQRLADPALGWNPEPPVGHPANQPNANGYQPNLPVNPYITVDWMPMDLTVFNGEDDDRAHPQEAKANIVFDPQDPNQKSSVRFRTRERSEQSRRPNGNQNIWIQNSYVYETQVNSTRNEDYFGFNLHHTFGALNSTYWPVPAAPVSTPMEQFVSRGLTNVPMQPFPWIVWNNRPFVNQYELMQVPVSSPSRLLYEASTDNGASPYRFNRPARDPQNPPNQNALSYEQARAPFRHLLNFLHSDEDAGDAPNLMRLFEFVETPSPFAGTKEWLEPATFAWTTGTPPQVLAQADSLVAAGSLDFETRENLESLVAPMNHVYAFRNPGLVNVNTITDPRVLDAVAPGLPFIKPVVPGRPRENDFVSGRQGTFGNLFTVPSAFSQPFRSTLASDLSPLPAGERAPTDATLFRTDQGLQTANGGPPNGNLGGQQGKPQPSEDPLFDNSHGEVFRNSERHSYFKNQDLRRLGNLTTTHSNVYAVWITVGYFEVLPWNANDPLNTAAIPTPDLAHPDGYQLGRELGSETGQINRDRAFYIIDRSIPVGFEKGKNHNVDQTILLERFIED